MPIGLVAAGVGAAGAIGGAAISSSAASSASKASTAADTAATTEEANANAANLAETQREFNTTQTNEAPFLTTGTSALDTLANVYGLSTAAPGATGASGATAANPNGGADYSSFYQSPDYQFTLQQGLKGVQASQAANGSLESGATDKAEEAYAGNLANTNFNQYASRLQSLAGIAQTSAGTDASAATSTANSDAASTSNTANQISAILQSQGNNAAAAALAKGSSYGQAIGQAAGIGTTALNTNAAQYAPLPANYSSGVNVTPPVQIPQGGY